MSGEPQGHMGPEVLGSPGGGGGGRLETLGTRGTIVFFGSLASHGFLVCGWHLAFGEPSLHKQVRALAVVPSASDFKGYRSLQVYSCPGLNWISLAKPGPLIFHTPGSTKASTSASDSISSSLFSVRTIW